MKMHTMWSLWQRFWFQPISPSVLCFYRILFGLIVFLNCLMMAPHVLTFFGENSLYTIETAKAASQKGFSVLFFLPQQNSVIIAAFALYMLSALCVMLGIYTRLSTIVLFIFLISFHHRNTLILYGGDSIVKEHAFIMMFAPAGLLYSVDWLKKRVSTGSKSNSTLTDSQTSENTGASEVSAQPTISAWPLRLLQLQIASVYCQSFWGKMNSAEWIDGTAVYYASRLTEMHRFAVPYLFDHLWTCQLLTYGALFIEFALFTLIWIKEFRYPVLILGVLLHLGIEWTMSIHLFEWIMIFAFSLFIYPEDLQKFLRSVRGIFNPKSAPRAEAA